MKVPIDDEKHSTVDETEKNGKEALMAQPPYRQDGPCNAVKPVSQNNIKTTGAVKGLEVICNRVMLNILR